MTPYNEDLVKFAKLGYKDRIFPILCYWVRFDTRTPEILVNDSQDWQPLNDVSNLPYSVPLGLRFRGFLAYRVRHHTEGALDPQHLVPLAPPGRTKATRYVSR